MPALLVERGGPVREREKERERGTQPLTEAEEAEITCSSFIAHTIVPRIIAIPDGHTLAHPPRFFLLLLQLWRTHSRPCLLRRRVTCV